MYHNSKKTCQETIELLEVTAYNAPYETTVIGALVGWGITLLWFGWDVIPSIIGVGIVASIGWAIGMSHRHMLLEDINNLRKEMEHHE